MAEAVQRERRMYLVNQARLDVEHWMQELEREELEREERRREAEELVPPPYSRQPKLPTWGEHPDLQAEGEEERGARAQSAERRCANGPLSNSENAQRKQHGPIDARVRYPPPSYSPC
ncbi:hypothetical protein AX14_003990 [Amanita brunnescens Koide BX004]|nr:hypothetical protein AX14_003990 [Amanita brunnescens Koide BX004]